MRRHTSLPLRSLEENLLGERRNKRREAGDCRLGTSAQIAWVLSPRPKTQCGSALSLNPTTVHMGPPRAAISPFPEADVLTAGPPLAHAHWGPTAASSKCLTVPPLRAHSSRCTAPRSVPFGGSTAQHRGPGLGTHHLPAARFASASCEESHPSGCTPRPWTRATALPAWSPIRVLLTG